MSSTEKPKRATRRERLAAAFRVRAGVQGLLACCTCEFPLVQHATATFHDASCPAHAMTASAIATGTFMLPTTWTQSGVVDAPPTTKRTRTK